MHPPSQLAFRAMQTYLRMVMRTCEGQTATLRARDRKTKKPTGLVVTAYATEQEGELATEQEFRHLTQGKTALMLVPVDIEGQPLPDLTDKTLEWIFTVSTDPENERVVEKIVREKPGRTVFGYLVIAR